MGLAIAPCTMSNLEEKGTRRNALLTRLLRVSHGEMRYGIARQPEFLDSAIHRSRLCGGRKQCSQRRESRHVVTVTSQRPHWTQ